MARILVSDTEAFAPTYKSTYVPLEELPKDKQLRRLSAEIGLAEKAIPLADLVARGGSTLYGGIKDWFAEREQKEEAEKAGARGGKQLPPEDFSGAEAKAEPTVTQAGVAQAEPIKAGGPVSLPDLERAKIAQQRLEQIKKQELGFPQREPKLSLEHREVAAPTPPAEPSALDRLSLQRKRTQKPGELSLQTKPEDWFSGPPPREEPSVVGTYLPGKLGTYLPGKQGQETEYEKTPGFDPLWVSSQSLMPEREKELGELLGKQPPMSIRQMRSPQLAQPEMGESGDWFQPELKLKGMPVAAAMTPAQRAEALRLAMPQAAAPSAPAADKIAQAEAIMAEERRKSPGAVTPAGAQPEAWSAPAGAKPVPHPFEQGVIPELVKPEPRMTLDQIDERVRRDAQAKAAAAEPEAAKPTGPLTIGTATESQLKMVKSRLEAAARAKPDDQELAGRLKDINDELDYRRIKDIPRTYEQWAAKARLADTPEEQARVLEMAKNIHMPAGGLADLLTPSSQLAERQALGTREERGLFPEVSRRTESQQMKDKAEAALLIAKANGLDMKNPAQAAQAYAAAELALAGAGLKTEQAKTEAGLREPKVVKTQEEAALIHKRESLMDAQIAELGSREALNRARAIRAKMAGVRGGGAGPSKEDRKWFDSMSRVAKELTADAAQAENFATQQLNAQILETRRAEERFQATAGALKETPETIVPGYDDAAEIRRKEEKNRRIAQAQANKEAFEASRSLEQKLSVERQTAEDRRKKSDERAAPFREAAEKFAIPAARRAGYEGPLLPQKKTEGGALGRLARVVGGQAPQAPATKPKKSAKSLLDELK